MSNFVDDLLDLPYPKDTSQLRPDIPSEKKISKTDWNRVCQAAIDLRGKVIDLMLATLGGMSTNRVQKATSATSVGDSSISDNGSTVTVDVDLSVVGDAGIGGDADVTGDAGVTGDLNVGADVAIIGSLTTNGISLLAGSGTPEGNVVAAKGSFYSDKTNGQMYFKSSGAGNTGWQAATIGALPDPLYGDGLDGALVFDGIATVTLSDGTTIVPSGNVYTMTCDVFASSASISAGVSVITGGWRFFCKGTLTIAATGKIHNSGSNASGATGGAGGLGGTLKVYLAGANGGSGATGASVGGAGSVSSVGLQRYFLTHGSAAANANGAVTGQGGGGGDNGGTGGDITVQAAQVAGPVLHTDLLHGRCINNANNQWSTGSGGGGGGTNGSTAFGGGGGGAGGVCFVSARALSGTGTIESRGGNGGNAVAGNSSHAGGGGGGGGGLVIMVYGTNGGVTTSVAGGSVGTPTGTGTTAGAGHAGAVISYNLSGDGT